ncbi:PEPxxWA-CTERM sorting domain-containing protein [Phenylobacterium sp.]|uniref:PEPxxWA-CTERM sorting domain-containing protein n=1 Tax=Phenylobacterium sp. TaxID=1871053 RepID=UPI002733AE47|nr:PEPxxWA-CTERM sorting domain-containing protein [Phenylobacterium sp.]MDP3853803.1 PEPxxWA-CTERM sorting domain-containing protein [Phenylobacterium sp.]
MTTLKKLLVGAVFAATASIGATAANAAVTIAAFGGYQTALNPGEYLVSDFDGPLTLAPGWSLVGGDLVTGNHSSPDASAAPGLGPVHPTDDDQTQYLSVAGGESATFTTTGAKRVSLYIGSLDTGNHITFHTTSGDYFFDGADLGVVSGAVQYGDRHAIDTNGRFTFQTDDLITGFTLFSKSDAFEISNIGSVVPEPATWAMMIIGFGGVGSMARSARRKQATAFA